jgi:hypothetical protein
MFQFSFSITKTVSKNISLYPITLAQVKDRSEYFRQNPTDSSLDSFINSLVIPKVVNDWEINTGYLLLDRTVQAFVPNIQNILGEQINISFEHLNIREFTNIKYYSDTWDYSTGKLTFDSEKYFFIPEAANYPAKLNFKENYLPVQFFQMRNNLEANYKAGFLNNVFTTLNSAIVDGLACQAAMAVDARTGFCQDFFSDIIMEIYAEYSIIKQEIIVL